LAHFERGNLDMTEKPDSVNRDVLFTVTDHIALVQLNRPERRNAVNGDVTRAMSWICKTVDEDVNIRVAVLTSANLGMFCAGADLGEIAKGGGADLMNEYGGFGGFVKAPREKPWIAAVDGPAMGGGFEFALSCDMIIASTNAKFGLPEVKRGLFAAAGGVFRLPKSLPRVLANELVVTGDPITADKALAFGLVNDVVAPEELTNAALALAQRIAANAPISVRESLKLARGAANGGEEAHWKQSNAAMMRVMTSADAREGPRAFMEKRAPNWSGT
jgi:enoyl-CoA hydratase/carnithine racemase